MTHPALHRFLTNQMLSRMTMWGTLLVTVWKFNSSLKNKIFRPKIKIYAFQLHIKFPSNWIAHFNRKYVNTGKKTKPVSQCQGTFKFGSFHVNMNDTDAFSPTRFCYCMIKYHLPVENVLKCHFQLKIQGAKFAIYPLFPFTFPHSLHSSVNGKSDTSNLVIKGLGIKPVLLNTFPKRCEIGNNPALLNKK